MRIANFTDTYLPHNNGVATSLYQVHHAKKDWQDTIFGPIDHPDVTRVSGVPFPIFPEYRLALNTGWLEKELKDFDVVHTHTPYGMFYYGKKLSRRLSLPLVGTFHTDPAAVFGSVISTDSWLGRPATEVTWKYLLRGYSKCDAVIAVSTWLGEELRDRGLKSRIETIPNGIDADRFNPDANSREFKEKFDMPDKPIVLFMGRLQHKKDPETFVRAALEAKSDAVFVLAGRGELEGRLKALAKGNTNIIFTGFLEDRLVPQAFAASDVFVLPSEMETQALVLIEALASGTPCISTDVGIAREVVHGDYLFEHGDHMGLAKRIDMLLEDRRTREKLGERGRKLVEEDYTIEAMIKNLGEFYETLEG
jgi:glycosyltransferase involved in cell wall biosynthesis